MAILKTDTSYIHEIWAMFCMLKMYSIPYPCHCWYVVCDIIPTELAFVTILSMLFPYMYEHDNKALQAVNAIVEIHSCVHRNFSTSVTALSMYPVHAVGKTWQVIVGKESIWTRISNYNFIYISYRSFHQTSPYNLRLLPMFGDILCMLWCFHRFSTYHSMTTYMFLFASVRTRV